MKKFILPILALALVAAGLPVLASGGADVELRAAAGEPRGFSEADFSSVASDDLRGVIVMSLPEGGVLEYGSREMLKGEGVLTDGLGGMRFTADEVGEYTFSVLPVYLSGEDSPTVSVRVSVSESVNENPVAEDVELCTYKNVPVGGAFCATDPEGGALTYRLVSKSARGGVETDGGLFVYTPYEGKTGKDSFTYVAVDEAGNVSNEAVVRIKIEKRAASVTYSDLLGDPAHAAAIRLAEENVYVGRLVDGEYIFGADEPVTRGEFVAMAVAAAGLSGTDVTLTGFTDDADIDPWLRPYVATAVIAGAVSGIPDGDNICFMPSERLTGAQAAVVAASLMGLDTGAVQTLGDNSPAWAAPSVAALGQGGALPQGFSASSELTRAEAAVLLCALLDS